MEINTLSVLALVTFGLMIAVTGGVVYLTLADWRDRRRRDQESRTQRISEKKR